MISTPLALSVGIEGVLILSAFDGGAAGAGRFLFFRRKNLAAGLVYTAFLALARDEPAVYAARESARTSVR